MNPHRDEFLELCSGYVLGNLSETELGTLEAHLKEGCGVCETEIDRLGRGAWAFAAATPRLLEPSSLRARVIGAVRSETSRREGSKEGRRTVIPFPRRRGPGALAWVGAAAAVVIAAFGWTEWRAAERLRGELGEARQEISRLNQQILSERQWSAVATAPQTRVIELAPTKDAALAGAGQLHARVTYDPATRQAIVSVSDFVTPAGKDYQLWAITQSGPASLGLVHADPQGRATIRITDAGDPFTLAAFAVSLENEGGAPTATAPAGPVVMVGKM